MDLAAFFAQAIDIERNAEQMYTELAERMRAIANVDAAAFFAEMAHYSALHRRSIEQRAHLCGKIAPTSEADAETPRLDVDSPSLEQAIMVAIAAETKAADWYEAVATATKNSELHSIAVEFALEERQHVLALERFLGRRPY